MSLARWVFEQIRERVHDGRLPAGSTLNERELGTELGVSRVPIREALPGLEAAGLVTLSQRRPAVVTSVTRTGVDDLYDLRSALEPFAARRAAVAVARGTAPDPLVTALDDADRALTSGDVLGFHRSSTEVHAAIEHLAGNALLPVVMDPLRERTGRLNVTTMEQALETRHAEHVALVDAIVRADERLAEAVAFAHVRWGRERAVATLPAVPGYAGEE